MKYRKSVGRRNERQQIHYRKTDNFKADGFQAVAVHRSRETGVRGKVKPLEAPTN
jgi:hypothetical protein